MQPLQRAAAMLVSLLLLGALAACGGGGDGAASPDGGPSSSFSTGLQAVGSSDRTVSLGWAKATGASGYTVERRLGDGPWTAVATLGADALHFLDDGLQRKTRYSYRVRADGTTLQAEAFADTGEDAALVTAPGTATGPAEAHAVGPAGGRLTTPDGRMRIDVPAGALAAATTLRLQPITNTAPSGLAGGLLLQVDGTLAKPMTVAVTYAEALAADADGLGVALQRADGSWLAMPVLALDKTARTLSVALDGRLHSGAAAPAQVNSLRASASVGLDFRLVLYRNFHLSPRQVTLEVGQSQVFVPRAHTRGVIGSVCVPDADYGCIPMPLVADQEVPFENSKPGYARRWYVFAQEGGDAASGTVTPRAGVGATYRAPARAPDVNPVLVSFVSTHQASGRSITVTASVTVKEPVWTGIARGTLSTPGGDLAFSLSMQAVWTADPQGDGARFTANGTQSVAVVDVHCSGTVSPASVALPPGALVIDRSVNPPRYTLDVGSVWRTTLAGSCPGEGSTSVDFDVPGRLVVEGTVGGNGRSISGTAVVNGIAWDWALTAEL